MININNKIIPSKWIINNLKYGITFGRASSDEPTTETFNVNNKTHKFNIEIINMISKTKQNVVNKELKINNRSQ